MANGLVTVVGLWGDVMERYASSDGPGFILPLLDTLQANPPRSKEELEATIKDHLKDPLDPSDIVPDLQATLTAQPASLKVEFEGVMTVKVLV